MSNELIPYGGSNLVTGDARRLSRTVSRVQGSGLIRQATVDAETDVVLSKLDAVTTATGQGLGAVGKVAQAEMAVVQMFPTASGRAAYIAERHTFAVSSVLDDLQSRLRRL